MGPKRPGLDLSTPFAPSHHPTRSSAVPPGRASRCFIADNKPALTAEALGFHDGGRLLARVAEDRAPALILCTPIASSLLPPILRTSFLLPPTVPATPLGPTHPSHGL